MANTTVDTAPVGATRLIEAIQDTEQSALEAVQKFVDTVNGVFPDVSPDGPRRKIIDSAFKMLEQLVGASTQLAQSVVGMTQNALGESEGGSASAR